MPVIPAQAGGSPRGNASSVREEGEAVQSGGVGSNRWKRLETHPNHTMGHGPGKCDPEGGAWARQERGDGRGRHHLEERRLHRGAQSEETLTDRTEEGRRENMRENHLKENRLCCDTPSLCLSAR